MMNASVLLLMVMWLLGMVTENTFNGAIHALVPAAVLAWFWGFIRERRNAPPESSVG